MAATTTPEVERCNDPCHVPDANMYGRQNVNLGLCSPGDDCSCPSTMFCSGSGYCWGGTSPCVNTTDENTTEVEVNNSIMGYTCCDNVQRRAIRGDFFRAVNLTECLGVCDEASDCAGIEWYTAYLDTKPCLMVTQWETRSSTPQVADNTCILDSFAASSPQSTVGTTQLCGLTVPLRVEEDVGTDPSTTTRTTKSTTTTFIAPAGTGGRSAAGADLSPAMLGVVAAALLAVIFFMVAYGCWWQKEKKKKKNQKQNFQRHEPKAPNEDHCATVITQDPIHAFKLDDDHQRHPNVFHNLSVMHKAVQARRLEFLGEKADDPELGLKVKPLALPQQQEPAKGESAVESQKRPPPVWHRPRDAFRKKEPETPIVAVNLDVGSRSKEASPAAKAPLYGSHPADDLVAEDVDGENEDLAKMRADANKAYTALGMERFRLRSGVVGVKAVGKESPRSGGSPVTAERKEREVSAPLPALQAVSPGSSKQPAVQQRDASAPIHYRAGELSPLESPINSSLRALAAPSPTKPDAWGIVTGPGVPPSLELGTPGGDLKKSRRMAAVVIMSLAEKKAQDSMVNLREVSEELKGHQHEAFMEEVLYANRKRGVGDFISLEDLEEALENCVTRPPGPAGSEVAGTLPQLRVT
mmetsp:Transcript_27319/g.62962  ORF Transcript_27319/g.62962 Transcript_27319/m.62962 type:complete len:639 (-) Transcript_27319:43-1959(-)